MAHLSVEQHSTQHNPLDILEELVHANEWPFERTSDAEMVIQLSGRWGAYRMFFAWQEDLSAMSFSCPIDARVPSHKRIPMAELLTLVNEKLWLGHFDLCSDELIPLFRHTVLLRGANGASVEQLEDLVDVALSECERFFPAFQFVLWAGHSAGEAVAAAMLETQGEA